MLPPVVCLSSVTFVHPTQPVEIFGNVSLPFGTLTIHWHPRKILRRSSHGNLSVRGFKCKWDSQIQRFWSFRRLCRKWCKIGVKLVLNTNKKSYISFWLVPKSVTLNDLVQVTAYGRQTVPGRGMVIIIIIIISHRLSMAPLRQCSVATHNRS